MKPFRAIDWPAVVEYVGGTAFRWIGESEFRFYRFGWGSGVLIVGDNGGEINVAAVDHAPVLVGSVPYVRHGVTCCAVTIAARLHEAIEGGLGSVDWEFGADLDHEETITECNARLAAAPRKEVTS